MYSSVANLAWKAIGTTFETVALKSAHTLVSIVLRQGLQQGHPYSHHLTTDSTRNSTNTLNKNYHGLTKVSQDIAKYTTKVAVKAPTKTFKHVV
jgi:hypothetical protein